MAGKINPDWIKKMKEAIEKSQFTSITLTYNPSAKWLIAYLDSKNIPIKVINLGAGVKKIIVAGQVCPTCNGKGYKTKWVNQ